MLNSDFIIFNNWLLCILKRLLRGSLNCFWFVMETGKRRQVRILNSLGFPPSIKIDSRHIKEWDILNDILPAENTIFLGQNWTIYPLYPLSGKLSETPFATTFSTLCTSLHGLKLICVSPNSWNSFPWTFQKDRSKKFYLEKIQL